jgi:hypothetical protein
MSEEIKEEITEVVESQIEEQLEDQDEIENESPEDDGELVITIEGEEEKEEEKDPDWLKNLRKQNLERGRKLKELERQLQSVTVTKKKVLRQKPTLADHDYDDEAFQSDIDKWYDEKLEIDKQEKEEEQKKKTEEEQWKNTVESYQAAKTALAQKLPDFDEAEEMAFSYLSNNQQGIIAIGADSPANIIYAIGKRPELAERLSKITDPIKFAVAIAKMEGNIKMTRKSPPPPEEKLSGTGGGIASTDKTLERLEKEADRTGDRTKLIQYKRSLKNKK